MVINDPDLMRVTVEPLEDDSPLVVDSDGVELSQGTSKLLQAIGRRDAQIIEPRCRIDSFQFPLRLARDPRELPHLLVVEQRCSLLVTE